MSPTTITKNIVGFLAIMTVDIVLNSIVLFQDMWSNLPNPPSDNQINRGLAMVLAIVGSSLQVILHLILIFWYFFLVWKTFPFRFGMLKRLLWSEFPVLMFVPLNFVLFVAERGYRLSKLIPIKADIVTLYDDPIYLVLFYTRQVVALIIFAASIKAAIQVGHPSYYKPTKWLIM